MKNRNVIKIDQVGRLVIPKEIRKMLGFNDKLVKIYVDDDKLIVKKYAPLAFCKKTVQKLCDKIAYLTGAVCFAGDESSIFAVSNSTLKDIVGKTLSSDFKKRVFADNPYLINASDGQKTINITDDLIEYRSLCLLPVKDDFSCVSFFALLSFEEGKFGEMEIYKLKIARELLLTVIERENGGAE